MEGAKIADRAALLAHRELVPWYVAVHGFQNKGDSNVSFGGGGWRALVSTDEATIEFITDRIIRPTSSRILAYGLES